MIEIPEITQSDARQTAIIPLTIPRREMQSAMGPGITELMTTIATQGIAPDGPWFSRHLKMDPETFDFEISVPVAEPVVAAGRVVPSELPARRVARTVYHGGYEGLGAAWGELDAWVATNGHTPAADLWECYVVGPESSQDSADWRTELNRPLAD